MLNNNVNYNTVNFFDEVKPNTEFISVDEINSILKARAKQLAKKIEINTKEEDFIDVLEFSLGAEKYAIEADFVREAYHLNNFTPLPGLPPFVLGIVNIRGQIISITDLRKILNIPAAGIGELNKIIVIRNEKIEFGILADNIIGTSSIPFSTIQTSFENIPNISNEYLIGVTNNHVIILDSRKVLEDQKIIIKQL